MCPVFGSLLSFLQFQYALMSVTKLSTRFPRATPKIQQIIDAFGSHIDTDLQQRGVEFSALFRHYDGMRSALLEPMPAFEKDSNSASQSSSMQDLGAPATNGLGSEETNLLGNFGSPTKASDVGSSLLDIIGAPASNIGGISQPPKTDNLLDLLEGLDFGSAPALGNSNPGMNNIFASAPSHNNILDGLVSLNSPPHPVTTNNTLNSLDDIFGDLGGGPIPASAVSAFPTMLVYDKDEFRITFDLEKSGVPSQVVIHLKATNRSPISNVTDFVLQAAVPKSMQLELSPPSSTTVPVAGGLVTQLLKVNNPSKASLKMRLKLNYNRAGVVHQDQMEVNDFPAALLQ